MAHVNGMLLFAADDGSHGEELWKSDGTEAGTALVKDINSLTTCNVWGYYPGSGLYPCNSFPPYSHWDQEIAMANANGTLFFAADDGSHGHELWALLVSPRVCVYLPVMLRDYP